jgi:single-strand DNA-binding protein
MQMLGNRDENQGGGGQGFSGEGGSNYSQGGGSSRGSSKPSGGFSGSSPADFDDPVFNPDDEIPF